jgi:chromosome segregation protein
MSIDDPGCRGNAQDFIRAPKSRARAVRSLLGRTLVVEDREAAARLMPDLPESAQLVTLEGDLFCADGRVILNAAGESAIALESPEALHAQLAELSTRNRELRKGLDELDRALEDAERGLEGGRERLEVVKASVERARHEYDWAEADLRASEKQVREQDTQLEVLEERRAARQAHLQRSGARDSQGARRRHALEVQLEEVVRGAEGRRPPASLAEARTRMELARNAQRDAARRLEDLSERSRRLEAELARRGVRLKSTREKRAATIEEGEQTEAELTELEVRIEGAEGQVMSAEAELRRLIEAREEHEDREASTRTAMHQAERAHSGAQIELARVQEEVQSLRARIEDDFGLVSYEEDEGVAVQEPLPFEGLVERLPRVEELPSEAEAQVKRMRAQFRRMGAVNPEAQREYEQVRSRVEFLGSQVEDLERAEGQIKEVIAELELLMEREFRKTFDAVAEEFREAFTRLFGGGSARLTLTEDQDLTKTGIGIEARLPGRREQGLAMLSGGERSLTATALIFALLKVSPTPFCVLDEVDAMLDESNVVRFREMLEELSRETQFVLITHNRQTVQASDVVYGVSMASDSTSQVISLKLDEAERAIAG